MSTVLEKVLQEVGQKLCCMLLDGSFVSSTSPALLTLDVQILLTVLGDTTWSNRRTAGFLGLSSCGLALVFAVTSIQVDDGLCRVFAWKQRQSLKDDIPDSTDYEAVILSSSGVKATQQQLEALRAAKQDHLLAGLHFHITDTLEVQFCFTKSCRDKKDTFKIYDL